MSADSLDVLMLLVVEVLGVCLDSRRWLTVFSLLIHSAILVSTVRESVPTALSSNSTLGVFVPISTFQSIEQADLRPSTLNVLLVGRPWSFDPNDGANLSR